VIAAGPTKIVVGGAIGAGLVAAIFALLGWKYGAVAAAFLAYESWTFRNRYDKDTISEVMWVLATRPLIPVIFGAAIGWAITAGVIPATVEGVWIGVAIGFLCGHFFWQAQDVYERLR
jgi:hypothetical protein